MESSTTDACEWCKRPMLPAGANVSGKAARELQSDASATGRVPTDVSAQSPDGDVPDMLAQEPETEKDAPPDAVPGPGEGPAEHMLRPLDSTGPKTQPDLPGEPDSAQPPSQPEPPDAEPSAAGEPGAPSHGLSDDAMRTSVDISQYVGKDQSIFRPIKQEEQSESPAGADPLARVGRGPSRKLETVSDIPENVRLGRSLLAGVVICFVLALVQFVATGQTPQQLYFLRLGRSDSILVAAKYGLATGLLLGLGLGALLTRLRRGPFLGALVGLVVAAAGFQNPPWALVAGALTGIAAGRFATVGLRQTLSI
jgi:hypothetical protein